MASNSGILTHGIQGAIGKAVVFKKINGKSVATAYPDRSHIKYTKKQVGYQNILKEAAAYASEILHDTEKNQAYTLKIKNESKRKRAMSVYHYAVQEFMNLHSKKVPWYAIEEKFKKYNDAFHLDEREIMVVKYLAAQREMSNADYRRMTGVSKPTATRHLGALVEKGVITGSSRGAGAVYVLVTLDAR